jgi:hypothetical protein
MAGDGPSRAEEPMLLVARGGVMLPIGCKSYPGTTASLERESIKMEVRAPRHVVCKNGRMAEE